VKLAFLRPVANRAADYGQRNHHPDPKVGKPGNNGTQDGAGYPLNPVTGEPYEPNIVPRADYARVLAEFWADGPASETPPGHWNAVANYVADQPEFEKRLSGEGPVLDDLEWDVKLYLALNGALHDAAVAAFQRNFSSWSSSRCRLASSSLSSL